MTNFEVGDIIKKIVDKDPSNTYLITSIKIEQSGNWHDGYYEYMVANIVQQKYYIMPTEEFVLMYHNYGSEPFYHATIYKKNPLKTWFTCCYV